MPKKLDRCVRKVRKSSPKVNPYAVCKASINKKVNMKSTIRNGIKYYLFSMYGRKKDKNKALTEARIFRGKGRRAFVKEEGGWWKVYAVRLKSDKIINGKIYV